MASLLALHVAACHNFFSHAPFEPAEAGRPPEARPTDSRPRDSLRGDSRERGPVDQTTDAAPDPNPPRQIAPLAMSTATSRSPTFRWSLAPATDGAKVEICHDPMCKSVAANFAVDAPATSGKPTALADGVYWWRLKSLVGKKEGSRVSPPWEFFVRNPRSTTVDTAWGNVADLNGDGLADILVGADGHNNVRLFWGTAGGAPAPGPLFTAPSGGTGYFGGHVSTTDVDGDGRPDLFIGAPTAKAAGVEVGKVFVYLNGPGGIEQSTPTALTGTDPDGKFGVLAAVGDFNCDGYGDLVVAAPAAKVGATSFLGKVFIYVGSAAGLKPTPWAEINSATGANLGHSIAAAGDVDGDGCADIVVGTYAAEMALMVYGGANGIKTKNFVYPPTGGGGQFGWSVAGAGDVNGDGYADVLVGAIDWKGHQGRAYVFLGGPSGVATTPDHTLESGDSTRRGFGHALSGAGDLDGDGYADFIVNAIAENYPPAVYVYHGGVNTDSAPTVLQDGRPSFAQGLAGVGDVNGDGRCELAVAAPEPTAATGSPVVLVYKGMATGVATTPTWTLTGLAGSHFGINIGKTY